MKKWMALALVASALAGCGGGNGNNGNGGDPTASVPRSASESSAGLVAYLKRLVESDADTKEPVSVDEFDPKKPDDTESETL
jgi:uncharacterized protein YcfL